MGKPTPTENKLRGGYYTPPRVAAWLARWAIRSEQDRVLEPSCGDGAFVAAAAAEIGHRRTLWSERTEQIVAVELMSEEAEKARQIAPSLAAVVNEDFFSWLDRSPPETFDVVLGNPPFIRYQTFPEPARTKAMRLMADRGLSPNRLTNMWVPFVVASVTCLRDCGRLAMVLPAELLQVSYSAQLRRYLTESFRRITIYACNEMFFDGAEQEVVLLAAEGKVSTPDPAIGCDIALVQTNGVEELLALDPLATPRRPRAKVVRHDTEKWLKYFLDVREIAFMRAVRDHERVGTLADHASVDVGVVTGKNEFFVLSREQVDDFELSDFVVPLVGRAAQLPGAVLSGEEHRTMSTAGQRVYLLNVTGREERSLPAGLQALIRAGEKSGHHLGYKCRIRQPWYRVPAVWTPDCFLFRQIYDFPRVVHNRTSATSTDTIHRMRCPTAPDRVAANMYTHLTAASAEIEGRSYGGGVLELEPTEAERLLVPNPLNGAMPIDEADRLIRAGQLADVLEHNDRVVLRGSLGFSQADCTRLKKVWTKMRDRRSARRRS